MFSSSYFCFSDWRIRFQSNSKMSIIFGSHQRWHNKNSQTRRTEPNKRAINSIMLLAKDKNFQNDVKTLLLKFSVHKIKYYMWPQISEAPHFLLHVRCRRPCQHSPQVPPHGSPHSSNSSHGSRHKKRYFLGSLRGTEK